MLDPKYETDGEIVEDMRFSKYLGSCFSEYESLTAVMKIKKNAKKWITWMQLKKKQNDKTAGFDVKRELYEKVAVNTKMYAAEAKLGH